MKKILSLILLLCIAMACLLSGCGANGHVGSYTFRMGKKESANFSLSMTLTDDDYTEQGQQEVLGKKYTLTLVYNLEGDIVDTEIEIGGYYNISEKKEEKGNRISIAIKELIGIELPEGLEIPSEVIEQIFICYINGAKVSVIAPVSKWDLLMQLYWYGNDFGYVDPMGEEPESLIDAIFGPNRAVIQHEVGSHPTAEDIEKINNGTGEYEPFGKYPDYHKEYVAYSATGVDTIDVNFRDYNVISVDLMKE